MERLKRDILKLDTENLEKFKKSWKEMDFGGITLLAKDRERKKLVYLLYSIALEEDNVYLLYGVYRCLEGKYPPLISLESLQKLLKIAKEEEIVRFLREKTVLRVRSGQEKYQDLIETIKSCAVEEDIEQLIQEL